MKKLLLLSAIMLLCGLQSSTAQCSGFKEIFFEPRANEIILSSDVSVTSTQYGIAGDVPFHPRSLWVALVNDTCNPANNLVWLAYHRLPPVGDTCHHYLDNHSVIIYTTDASDQHQIRYTDDTTGITTVSAWFDTGDTLVFPLVFNHWHDIQINTIHGTDTCGWSGTYSFMFPEPAPPTICPPVIHHRLTNPIAYANPSVPHQIVNVAFESTETGTGQIWTEMLHMNYTKVRTISIDPGHNEYQLDLDRGAYITTVKLKGESRSSQIIIVQ